MFIPQEIIRKKRDGYKLTKEEISSFIKGYTQGTIPDYQMAALAMAIFLKGFDAEETAALLEAMIQSGVRYDWSKYRGSRLFVDKHSTGGVGDKTSLIILPLLVADGLDVPMISGRGLGHTGGTLDKLESLPGFRTRVDTETFLHWMDIYHGAFGAQTDTFVPADKKLYALRDVTATVESQALITASIMSKKIAEGLDALVLDVKFGSGAFMPEYEKAKALAQSLVAAGKAAGCRCIAALTNMDEPLGFAAGNALEVAECLDIMQGAKEPNDTRELSLQLATAVACKVRNDLNPETWNATYKRMEQYLENGKAFEIFCQIAVNQGAKVEDVERKNTQWITGNSIIIPLKSPKEGTVQSIQTRQLGLAILELGGGRKRAEDSINPYVGLSRIVKVGQKVAQDEPLCMIHASPDTNLTEIINTLQKAFVIGNEMPQKYPLIREWLYD